MNKVTPIITVEAIEPCLSFWTERLGFEVSVTVPHGEVLGFAILQRDGAEVMYQTHASIDADLGASGAPSGLGSELAAGRTLIFLEVEALTPLLAQLEGVEVVVPRRQTFYGIDELFVRAPCGTVIGLAAKVET